MDKAEWESIKRTGTQAIEKWIDKQLNGTSVTVVLIKSIVRFTVPGVTAGHKASKAEIDFYKQLEKAYGIGIGYPKLDGKIVVGNYGGLSKEEFLTLAGQVVKDTGVTGEHTAAEGKYVDHDWSNDNQ